MKIAAGAIFATTMSISFAAYATGESAVNDKITPIVGKLLNGSAVSIESKPGQLILVSFYFSGCGPCIEELPYLNKFKKDHPNVRVVGVTFDTVQEVADFISKREVYFEIVADAQAFIDKVSVSKYPFIVLLSPEGRRIASIQGAVSIDTSTNRKVNILESWFKRVAPKT